MFFYKIKMETLFVVNIFAARRQLKLTTCGMQPFAAVVFH